MHSALLETEVYFRYENSYDITCNTTRLPALFKASTDTAWETFTTDMSLTLVIISLTLRRLSFAAAPPGMSFVIYIEVSVPMWGLSIPPALKKYVNLL